jgi:hypothetical protein
MTQLSPKASAVEEIAHRTGFSRDAVTSMLSSIVAGRGGVAQFSHTEFGGSASRSKGHSDRGRIFREQGGAAGSTLAERPKEYFALSAQVRFVDGPFAKEI